MSTSVKFNNSLKLLRNISHDLRKYLKTDCVKSNETMVYILEMYRKHDMTDQRVCRSEDELKYLSQTFLSYIESSLKYENIYNKFYSKRERSVGQTAQMLGFKLPTDNKSQ